MTYRSQADVIRERAVALGLAIVPVDRGLRRRWAVFRGDWRGQPIYYESTTDLIQALK